MTNGNHENILTPETTQTERVRVAGTIKTTSDND